MSRGLQGAGAPSQGARIGWPRPPRAQGMMCFHRLPVAHYKRCNGGRCSVYSFEPGVGSFIWYVYICRWLQGMFNGFSCLDVLMIRTQYFVLVHAITRSTSGMLLPFLRHYGTLFAIMLLLVLVLIISHFSFKQAVSAQTLSRPG